MISNNKLYIDIANEYLLALEKLKIYEGTIKCRSKTLKRWSTKLITIDANKKEMILKEKDKIKIKVKK